MNNLSVSIKEQKETLLYEFYNEIMLNIKNQITLLYSSSDLEFNNMFINDKPALGVYIDDKSFTIYFSGNGNAILSSIISNMSLNIETFLKKLKKELK